MVAKLKTASTRAASPVEMRAWFSRALCVLGLLLGGVGWSGDARAQAITIEASAGGHGPFNWSELDGSSLQFIEYPSVKEIYYAFTPYRDSAGAPITAVTFEVKGPSSQQYFASQNFTVTTRSDGGTTNTVTGDFTATTPISGTEPANVNITYFKDGDLDKFIGGNFLVFMQPDVTNIEIFPGDSEFAATLTPAFRAFEPIPNSGTYSQTVSFSAEVGESVTSVRLRPTYGASVQTFRSGKQGTTAVEIASGAKSAPITLNSGTTIIDASAVHNFEAGRNTLLYELKFRVTVSNLSTDTNLSSLTVDDGDGFATLSPLNSPFDGDTLNYTAAVGNGATAVTITPQTRHQSASFAVFKSTTEQTVTGSGAEVSLDPGTNPVSVVVTAENGNAMQTYTLGIFRAGAINALEVRTTGASPAAIPITPAFDQKVTAYTASVAHSVGAAALALTVDDAADHSGTTISKGGASIATNLAADNDADDDTATSAGIGLGVGENEITLNVGGAVYMFTITRAAGPPSVPRTFTAQPDNKLIALSWTAPASNGGAEISGYRYRWSNDNDTSDWESAGGEDGVAIFGGGTKRAHTIENLSNGVTYVIQLAADNFTGTGQWEEVTERPLPKFIDLGGAKGADWRDVEVAARFLRGVTGADLTDGIVGFENEDPGFIVLQLNEHKARLDVTGDGTSDTTDTELIKRYFLGQTTPAQLFAGDVFTPADTAAETAIINRIIALRAAPGAPAALRFIDVGGHLGSDWQDAIAVARYFIGLRGADLIAGLDGFSAEEIPAIESAVATHRSSLDIDTGGEPVLSEVIVIVRHFLGATGDSLFSEQIGDGAGTGVVNTLLGRLSGLESN